MALAVWLEIVHPTVKRLASLGHKAILPHLVITELRMSLPNQTGSRWKRVLHWGGKTALFALVSTVTLVALLAGYSWYSDLPTPAKKWPQVVLSEGIKLDLKTMARGSQVHYQFVARPTAELASAFRDAGPTFSRTGMFTLLLNDKNGFELCRESIDVIGDKDKDGLAGFSSSGSFYCGDYKQAADWNVTYSAELGSLKERPVVTITPDTNVIESGLVPKPRQQGNEFDSEEVLAGYDMFSRVMQAKSGLQVRVAEAGSSDALGWRNGAHLSLKCKRGVCTMDNLDNGEAVRALLLSK